MENTISFVIPVFNEQDSLVELFRQIKQVLKSELSSYNYEVIFINDGSTDNSLDILKELNRKRFKSENN